MNILRLVILTTILLLTFAAQAEWVVPGVTPTEREDNSVLPVNQIKGFNMYCGGAIGDYQDSTFFPGATVPNTEFIIADLAVGAHYCVFTTVDVSDRESMYSNMVTLINDGAYPPKPPLIQLDQVIKVVTTLN